MNTGNAGAGFDAIAEGCRLDDAAISAFIADNDAAFDGALSGVINYSRVVSLAHFDALTNQLGLKRQRHVGVISGSAQEPELRFLKPEQTSVLSFDRDRSYDLDQDWSAQQPAGFSLTICNQTLEHVFDPQRAFKNLLHHTAPGGHVYVSIPVVNCIHGEPYFYSSGFHPRFLARLAKVNGLETAGIGHWGSYKYLINAVSGDWLPARRLRRGCHGWKDLQHPVLMLADGRKGQDQYMTDCWGLFRKPVQA